MRDILFKGKSAEDGKWMYGYYCEEGFGGCDFCCILPGDGDPHISFAVDPATVGQYTGLTDKNGVKVFKGDIVNCSSGCPHEVIWIQEHGGTFSGGMPTVYLSGLREGYAWMGAEEVIGNIHDNPELLEATPC